MTLILAMVFWIYTKSKGNQSKNLKAGLHQTKKFLHIKGNHHENEKGDLVYGESHINCNMFNIKGLEKIGSNKLPYHVAFKKANYMDKSGNIIVAEEPNAYKFESFIFDAFGKLDNMLIYRVKREEEFSPVKNATGVDSAETARIAYSKQKNKDNVN